MIIGFGIQPIARIMQQSQCILLLLLIVVLPLLLLEPHAFLSIKNLQIILMLFGELMILPIGTYLADSVKIILPTTMKLLNMPHL